MQCYPLFESLLYIVLKVLSFLLPITLLLFITPLINHEKKLHVDGAVFQKTKASKTPPLF